MLPGELQPQKSRLNRSYIWRPRYRDALKCRELHTSFRACFSTPRLLVFYQGDAVAEISRLTQSDECNETRA